MSERAKGFDGQWHDWDELTAEEQAKWMEGLTIADRMHDAAKNGGYAPMNLRQGLLERENGIRMYRWE